MIIVEVAACIQCIQKRQMQSSKHKNKTDINMSETSWAIYWYIV